MPNGEGKVKSWSEIATNFDPMMPADVYDNLRLKYFSEFVAPKVGRGKSVEATWSRFKELTERPSLLGPGGKPVLFAQLSATAGAGAMLEPLKAFSPDLKQLHKLLQMKELQLTQLGEREGMNTTVPRVAGSFTGQAIDFGVLTAVLGPEAGLLAQEMTKTAKGAQLVTRVLRGGLAFGAYDALSADDKDNRLLAGVKGFAVGATLDLALGLPGYLRASGVAKTVEEAEKAIVDSSMGKPSSDVVDTALMKKAVHDADVQRLELRPERGHWSYSTGQRGARIYVRDVAGQVTPVDIRPGREYDAYREIRSVVEQGGSVSHYEVNPDDQRVLNEFIRIQTTAEEAKYRGTVIRTPPGQAEEVVKTAKGEGLPAEALSGDTVEVGTIPVEHPIMNKPTEAAKPKLASVKPVEDTIKQALDKLNVDARTRNFLERQVERIWDPNIDFEDKRAGIIITARHVPELLPEEYRAKVSGAKGSRPGPPPVEPSEGPSEIEQVRQETIDQAGKAGKPTAVPKYDIKEKIPRSEQRKYRNVRAGIRAEGETHDSLADALDASGDHRLLSNPAGRKTLGSQLGEANLKGRLMGSVEDVPLDRVPNVGLALMNKGWKVIPLKGYRPNEFELVYFKEGDIAKVAPLINDYDQYIAKQAGRVFDTDGKPVRDLGREAHARLGRAFGVPESEIAKFDPRVQGEGVRPAPEVSRKPYGNRLVLQFEDLQRLYPGAGGLATPSMDDFAKALGVDLPASLKGGEPLVILTPQTDKATVFHERLHINGMHAGTYNEFSELIPEGHRQTALELANGLAGAFQGYSRVGARGLVEEAFTHAATALRYGDRAYLEHLARMDKSVQHVIDFVGETANNLLERSFRSRDSVPVRIFQRTLWDLMRRASPEVSEAIRQGSRATGTGIASWYDAANDQWVLKETATSERRFKDINDLWDHVTDRDKNFMAPSASLRSELGGVRGPMVPSGSEPNGGPLPIPEGPLDAPYAGLSAVSALWRPFFPWLATLHENMNALFKRSGKYLPLYETTKAVDDQFRLGDHWLQTNYEKIAELLRPFKGKKQSSLFDYLTHPEVERTSKLMSKYGLTQADAINAHKVWEYLLDFRNQTQIDVIQYLTQIQPKLRAFGWAPERAFGAMTTPQTATYWDKLIRHEGKWEPQDNHLGRFLHTMLREGMEKKFTGEPLAKLDKLLETKSPDGTYVIPNSVRWPISNYSRYMRGIPDTSQQAINKVMSDFFTKANERIKQINQTLPAKLQLPIMDAPPRQVLNRFMLMSYAMGLGLRPAIAIRDMMQAFTGGMTVLGPARFTRAFVRFMTNPRAALDRADQLGALLRKNNVGELYGDIMGEIPTEGPGWMDRVTKWSNSLLAPSRWGHNFGRAIMFDGEYHDAIEAIKSYRAGRTSIDQLLENTSMWFMDRPAQSSLLRDISNPGVPVEDAATKVALEAVDLTQWPYRRGTQPTLLRYGAGRIFGQYGVWPANYADFLYRIGRKWAERPQMAARTTGTWVAVNYALTHGMNALGADTSKWFWQSPAGFAGSPHWDFIHALMVAPENTDEGREARKTIIEYPLNFVPAMAEMKAVAKAIEEGGFSDPIQQSEILRVLGFRPLDDTQKEQEWDDFVKTQLGYEGGRRRR